MSELVSAIGLVLVIEGLIWALFPRAGVKMLEAAAATPEDQLRLCGAVTLALGVLIIWLVRG